MRQDLGKKKTEQIAKLTGRPVYRATVRGGTRHHWALVQFRDGGVLNVNYKTGETEPVSPAWAVPWWGSSPPPEGCGQPEREP